MGDCLNIKFGKLLMILRTARGLSQAELADKAGIVRSQVCRWENSKGFPGYEDIARLKKALDFPYEAFFDQPVKFGIS